MTPIRILVITRKPEAPSFEQRFALYVQPMAERGVEMTTTVLGRTAAEQRAAMASAGGYDGVWWHRHLLSPRLWGALRRIGRPVVYDYDDAMPMSQRRGGRRSWTRRWKFAAMVRRSDVVVAASDYLADLARPWSRRIVLRPNAQETPAQAIARRDGQPIELLWLGSRSTQPYLEIVRPALERIATERDDLRLRLVAHEPMAFGSLAVDFRRWSSEEQARALVECHVGLNPMTDDPWSRGKCSQKVLQYMAYNMAWIGSAAGQNLVMAGEPDVGGRRPCGRCAATPDQWYEQINELADDVSLRRSMGDAARAYILAEHDRGRLADRMADLWRDLAARPRSDA